MDDKLFYLSQIRNDVDEDKFRFIAAEVTVNYYSKKLKKNGKKVNKKLLMDRTNLALRSLGVDEISYGFIRHLV